MTASAVLDALRPAMVQQAPARYGDDALRPRHYRDAPLGSSAPRPPSGKRRSVWRLLRHGGFDVSSKAQFKPRNCGALEVAIRWRASVVALLLRAGATPSTADAYQGAKRGRARPPRTF